MRGSSSQRRGLAPPADALASNGVSQEDTASAPRILWLADADAALTALRPAERHSLGVKPSAKPTDAKAKTNVSVMAMPPPNVPSAE
ncbi:MAG: hypothetical protein B7Y73_10215 [Acidocella sp. 35-58-6]|nr:MAG: hypothetical protein B7Y73_10215 [Acidocella sp. 35-58-6]